MKERPKYLTNEMLTYLDELRESGDTNMYGAVPFLRSEFSELNKFQAGDVLGYWMNTFAERHTKQENENGS